MFENLDFTPGKVVYNDFDINHEIPLSEQIYSLKEDLFQVNYNNKYVIDIGWYPEFKTIGEFNIVIIKDFDWENPIEKKTCKDIKTLKLYLQDFRLKVKNLIDYKKTKL
ncbi:hypothetical protein RBH29_17085 [Herbivorax sp. ANBcel31]|uniref:hypothetical protein n=1 Tax=Herbivorax sp. ANBcel31 TaxID=3069754 RepID=UPI0027B6FD7B|nr:hypothetical protein [Herbivorax sp. ANBcel31]MDQ2088142.1 hypothetical protein [Herbivorax sp. ANBcel31]